MSPHTTRSLERLLHRFFAAGLAVSAILIATGIALVMRAGEARPGRAPTLGTIGRDALRGDPLAWLYAGLVALMLIPIVRVVLMAAAFVRLREWRFAVAALAVLLLLLVSMVLGLR